MKKDVKKSIKDESIQPLPAKKSEGKPGETSNRHEDLGEDLTMDEEEEALKKPAPNEEL